MASTLLTNNILDSHLFSSSHSFKRPQLPRTFSATDTNSNSFALHAVSNIWQMNPAVKPGSIRDNNIPSTMPERLEKLSAATTDHHRVDTRTSCYSSRWPSLTDSDAVSSRFSATRSSQDSHSYNDNIVSTPTSLSSAEHSPIETMNLPRDRTSRDIDDFTVLSDTSKIWLNAREFTPFKNRLVDTPLLQSQQNNVANSASLQSHEIQNSWFDHTYPTSVHQSLLHGQSDFRPVLVAPARGLSKDTRKGPDLGTFGTIGKDFTSTMAQMRLGDHHSTMEDREKSRPSTLRPQFDAFGSVNRSQGPYFQGNIQHKGSNLDGSSNFYAQPYDRHLSTVYRRTVDSTIHRAHQQPLTTPQSRLLTQSHDHSQAWHMQPNALTGNVPQYDRPQSFVLQPQSLSQYPHTYHPSNPLCRAEEKINCQASGSRTVQSALLEEFRQNYRTKRYELRDIFGHIVEFSGDQHGSRLIQAKLEVANGEEKEQVFAEIVNDARQLMTDLYGNYVIQKMFEHGSQSQKKVLANHMKGHVYTLSTQMYGCRVVQKALEHVLTEQQVSLLRELDGLVLKAVDDQNGNHVIQRAIECVPREHIQFIVDAFRGHVHFYSKHAYGCRVMQRMLEHCTPAQKRILLDELQINIGDLIQDAFGNYVVQHVIINGEPRDQHPTIEKIHARLLDNSMHKFASNVVEKALAHADSIQRHTMLAKLTARDEHGQSQILTLLGHQFGNYVIQKSVAYMSGTMLENALLEMEVYLSQLRRVSTGKQVSALEQTVHAARHQLEKERYQGFVRVSPLSNHHSFKYGQL